jgi:hypothetical protein
LDTELCSIPLCNKKFRATPSWMSLTGMFAMYDGTKIQKIPSFFQTFLCNYTFCCTWNLQIEVMAKYC